MAGRTRVLILRLRSGGVLLVAPASVMPWPRLLNPRAQRLQEFGLRSALTDPAALARLRAEYSQLVGAPVGRRAATASPEELMSTLLTGARTGRLTVIFGYGEPRASTGRPGELPGLFAEHPVVGPAARAVRAPALDPAKGPPKSGEALPRTFDERLRWVCGRAPCFMAEDAAQQMREFFSGAALATTVALLALWASSHVIGVGFVVDAALFAAAVWQLGQAALKAFEQLKEFFDLTRNAASWSDLDKAAALLAAAVVTLGAVLFRQLLRRVGGRVGRSGGEANAAPPPKVGKPATRPSAPPKAAEPAPRPAPPLPPLRQQYVDRVNALRQKAETMRSTGASEEAVARTLHAERRALGEQFKALTPPEKLAEIYARNEARYGDRLGPSIDWLRARGKSWAEIAESASRPGGKDLGF